jgi:tRNA(Arg) A34 adenosine deaminase TadA
MPGGWIARFVSLLPFFCSTCRSQRSIWDKTGMTTDEDFLRRTLQIALQARAAGNHPFGAILVDPDGTVLMEAGNALGDAGDRTAHAERVLMTRASQIHSAEFLAGCTMYASAEPCAMCAGSAYWAGVGRVVYGLSERDLAQLIGPHPENLTMDLPCRVVLTAGQRMIEVVGPLLEHEARAVHAGFWR